jgi:hypothetical protein
MSQHISAEHVEQRMSGRRTGRLPKYPYRDWVDGEWHELWAGTDYHCTTSGMKRNIYGYARYHGLQAHTREPDDGTLFVRFVTPGYDEIVPVKAGPIEDYLYDLRPRHVRERMDGSA